MNESKDSIPYDALANINQDGSVTKLVVAPLIVIAIAIALILVVRLVQKSRERADMEASLKE